jgi:hypothetical protein
MKKIRIAIALALFFLLFQPGPAPAEPSAAKELSDADPSLTDNGLPDANEDEAGDLSGKHDPFHLPKKKVLNQGVAGGVHLGQWHLTGILAGASGGSLAIINDRLVSEGDKILGGVVDLITPDSVVIKGPFGTRELKMSNFTSEGRGE